MDQRLHSQQIAAGLNARNIVPRWALALAGALIVSLAAPLAALAHAGPPPQPDQIWISWSLDPSLLLPLLLAAWLYLRGLRQLWRNGVQRRVNRWQAEAFFTGLSVIFVALVSPLDGLSSALFSAHMVQHLLLILVAAPLLVLGAPLVVWLYGLPLAWRRRLAAYWKRLHLHRVWQILTTPAVAWVLAAATLWIWHAPIFYEAALHNQAIHSFEHVTLLGTAFAFWYVALPVRRKARLSYGATIAYLFTAAAQCAILGIIITVSPSPWYPSYDLSTLAWHLTPEQDQQISGLIMWIPAGGLYLLAALALLARWTLVDNARVDGASRLAPTPPGGHRAQPGRKPQTELGRFE